MGIPSGRQHERVATLFQRSLGEHVASRDEIIVTRAGRKWNIHIVSRAGSRTALIRIADEERVIPRGIGVNRACKDVVAGIEDRLGTVTVMRIEIENGDPAKGSREHVCDNSGIIDVAESGCLIAVGMMTGWTARGERTALAGNHHFGRMDRALRRKLQSLPKCPRRYRN